MNRMFCFGIFLLAVVFLSTAMSQGLYWESTTVISAAQGKEIHSTLLYRSQMFKQSSEHNSTIFRLDKEILYYINTEKKEYSELTFAELETMTKKMSSEMDGKMAEIKKKMEGLPAEQRQLMEKMMGGSTPVANSEHKIAVEKTSETKSISGYPCVKYLLKDAGKEIGSIWTTTKVADFSKMKKDFQEFSKRMASLMPKSSGQLVAAMEKVDGFTIQSTIAGITTTVSKVIKKSPSMSEFEVPSGYKKVSSKNLMGQ